MRPSLEYWYPSSSLPRRQPHFPPSTPPSLIDKADANFSITRKEGDRPRPMVLVVAILMSLSHHPRRHRHPLPLHLRHSSDQ